ncbi:hypothetical protein FZEAL_5700 [Fusarium zealandicum]|uniref:alpha-1,2-Mannosidase n=1 Tax=Fusarium zealandicum TaxID=1053134 RepID=A0A8H4UJ95_9HYPO|nr:hypothetical protein FZEAL_5700 [Fusarium zealandicum]
MLGKFQGRLSRRYFALFTLIALTYFLVHSFRPLDRYRIVRIGTYDYLPTSYDWSKTRVYHAPDAIKPLPNGTAKILPRIQFEPSGPTVNHQTVARKTSVKQAFVKSWAAYKEHAWGGDELAPLSLAPKQTFHGWSAQIIDALDTLWLMDMKEEFQEAVQVVATIDWGRTTDSNLNLFEVVIRHLGGLLSAYELSDEAVLLGKAIELGEMLYSAFDTPNRLPSHWLFFSEAKSGGQQADESMSGAAGGSMALEFTRLSQITGNPKFYDATERLKQFFLKTQNSTKIPGLWPHALNYRAETAQESRFTMGSGTDSLYEYLPKMHALLGGLDPDYVHMTKDALDAAKKHLLYRPQNPKDLDILMAGNAVVGKDGEGSKLTAEMQHLTCFVGGTYALAGKLLSQADYVDLGSRLTSGCVWAYDSFPSGIMPEIAQLDPCETMDSKCKWDDKPVKQKNTLPKGFLRMRDGTYRLRPEAIESVFYMWRITGDQAWRDAAWRMWQAILTETATDNAFATISDVNKQGSAKRDNMETFWLSETTKYFFLIFEDPNVLNLDEWVFNTEAHALKRPKGEAAEADEKKTSKPWWKFGG